MPYSPTSKGTNRASASPSISSLINPPSETEYGSSHRLQQSRLPSSKPSNGFLVSPTSPTLPSALQQSNIINISSDHEIHAGSSVDIEGESRTASPEQPRKGRESEVKKTNGGHGTTVSSAAPSPKPARQKAAPPPIPQGNGLLSSALFGGPTSAPAADLADNLPPTIILEISLKGESNKTINFARMAEERYGFNVLYPRIAAQQERLARVAAAGAALEQGSAAGSADEMSVDLSDPESNIEMSGIRTGDESATGTKRKRAAKTEEYDKDDPFVDDSEMLWEEQAAASKDGFFVYSGPLVPEGEKPSIERFVFQALPCIPADER